MVEGREGRDRRRGKWRGANEMEESRGGGGRNGREAGGGEGQVEMAVFILGAKIVSSDPTRSKAEDEPAAVTLRYPPQSLH